MKRMLTLLLAAAIALLPLLSGLSEGAPVPASLFSEASVPVPEAYKDLVGMAVAPDGTIYAAAVTADGASVLLRYGDPAAAPDVLPLSLGEQQIAGIDIAPDGKILATLSMAAQNFMQTAPQGGAQGGNAQMGTAQSGGNMTFGAAPGGNQQGNAAQGSNAQMGTAQGGNMQMRIDNFKTTMVWLSADGAEESRFEAGGFTSQFRALSGNRVAAADMQRGGVMILGADGGELSHIDGSAETVAVSATSLFAIGSREINEYEIETGKKLRTVAYDGDYASQAAVGADGTLYIVTSLGVYWLRPSDAAASLLMETTGTYLGDPANSAAAFGVRPDGSLALLFAQGGIGAITGGRGGQLTRSFRVSGAAGSASINTGEASSLMAVYTPISASVSDRKTFTITSLYASTRLRKAVTDFQRAHPELRVVLQSQISENDNAAAIEDHIRTLNTDLLAGKGGDVLVLDGLPVEKYMGKGLLRDLTGLLPELGLLSGIEQGSAAADGKVYAVPAQFSFETLWGKKDLIAQVGALSDLANVALPSGQTPLRARSGDDWVNLFFPASEAALSEEAGKPSFNTPAFQAFLEALYALYSTQGDIANDTMGMRGMRGGMSMGEMLALYNGSAAFCPMSIGGLMQINIVYSIAGGKDGACIALPSFEGAGRTYNPALIVGLNTQSKQQELGEAFLKTLFSPDVQEMEQMDGLPTAAKSLDKLFADAIERSEESAGATFGIAMMGGGGGGLQLTMENPDEAAWNALRALCDTLDRPYVSDQTLMDFILAETKDFFDGKTDAATAGNAVQQRAFFYLNE